jgi:LacI family transcriptional regulator
MPVTIADLARRAGVSRMTVSRALRNHPEVAAKTKARILSLAKSIGYRPNPLVSAWMESVAAGKRPNYRPAIGWLSGYLTDEMRKSMLFRGNVFPTAQKRAESFGFRLEDHPLFFDDMTPARLSGILATRGCPGVVLPPLAEPVESLDFEWAPFSVVEIGFSLRVPEFNRVSVNHSMGMTAALEGLLHAGKRKIGLVIKRVSDNRTNHYWTAAYLGYGWRQPEMKGLPFHSPAQLERRGFLEWFRTHRPEAIVGADPELIDWYEKEDRRGPAKRCVFVHLHEEFADDPRIFGVVTGESSLVASAAVEMLIAQVNHNERGIPQSPVHTMVPCRFKKLAGEASSVRKG